MESRTTRRFWRLFSALPDDVQRDAKRAYGLFQSNPAAGITSIRPASVWSIALWRL
jgi:hypothetical protein